MTNQTPFKIDDDSYREGQEAFKRGATLRSIVEQLATFGIDEMEDRKTFSGVLGFGDALLFLLRYPAFVVQQGAPQFNAGPLGSDALGMRLLADDLAAQPAREVVGVGELTRMLGARKINLHVSANTNGLLDPGTLRIEVIR